MDGVGRRPHGERWGVRSAALALLTLAVLGGLCSACSSRSTDGAGAAPGSTTTQAVQPSAAEPIGAISAGPEGEVLERESLAAPDGATAWRVRYRSLGSDGRSTAVSGMIIEPAGPPPPTGWPVLSWAHGTTGSADRCAPSEQGVAAVPGLADMLAAGFVVAATDYEGLGTPGPHPYLVGESEGRSVLDAARAARQLVAAATGPVVLWGHSQGGQAAVWAGELAAGYAPELPIAGVVAFAPAARLDAFLTAGSSPLLAGFEVAALAGLAAVHPDLHLAEVLVPAALNRLDVLERGCIAEVLAAFGVIPGGALVPDATSDRAWRAALNGNEAGEHRSAPPVLVLQGDADQLVRPEASLLYQTRACAVGSSVEVRRYPDADHGSVLSAGERDAFAWSAARIAGQPVPAGAAC